MDENYAFQDFRYTEEKSGKNPANIFETGLEPEPDIKTGYPAGTGFSRKSGRFLAAILNIYMPFLILLQCLILRSQLCGIGDCVGQVCEQS